MAKDKFAACIEAYVHKIRGADDSLNPSLLVDIKIRMARSGGLNVNLPKDTLLGVSNIEGDLYWVREESVMAHDLFIAHGSLRIAPHENNVGSVAPDNTSGTQYTLRFPFPLNVLGRIEDLRKGQKALFRIVLLITGHWQEQESACGGILSIIVGLKEREDGVIRIEKSAWSEEILPSLGYGRWRVFEIPAWAEEPEKANEDFKSIDAELAKAGKHFKNGEWPDSLAAARRAVDSLRTYFKEAINPNFTDERGNPAEKKAENLAEDFQKLMSSMQSFNARIYDLLSSGAHGKPIDSFEREDAQLGLSLALEFRRYVGLRVMRKKPA